MFFVVLVVCVLTTVVRASGETKGTVYYSSNEPHFTFVPGVIDPQKGIAYGSYDVSDFNLTGWGVLNIASGFSNVSVADVEVAMAAGILEGSLMQSDIYYNYVNVNRTALKDCSDHEVALLRDFLDMQRNWMSQMVAVNHSTYWYYVGLISAQFQGLMDGYNSVAPADQQLDTFAFDFLSANGDISDILSYVSPQRRPNIATMDREQIDKFLSSGHCSALIKVLPGYEDVFTSHSTWAGYATMMRTYKHYALKLRDQSAASVVMTFSSYPGMMSSIDDYYIMDSGLVVTETTNDVMNGTVLDAITPTALLSWQRIRLANWLATGGREWASYVSEYNSGTYNNQYMILDLKKVKLRTEIEDDALWIVEQIPGYVASGDQTSILRTGYWASYNIPFYEYVYDVSGYPELVKKFGPDFSYQLCPRAKIFRRDEASVKDLSSLGALLRSNNFKQDPYSEGNPANAICSRGDLAQKPYPGGCIDTKIADYIGALLLTSYAENGPTHQSFKPFSWSSVSQFSNVSHIAQPSMFDFGFVKMQPEVPRPS